MKVSAMKTYKDFIIYKGQDKEVQIPFAVSGFTDFTASFYTDKEYEILKTAEDFDFDGEWASIFFDNTDLDLLNDGVLRYTFNYKIDGVDVVKSTNSAYTLRTPENYSAHTADEVYQDGYLSGYTDGMVSGTSVGYEEGFEEGEEAQKAKMTGVTITENGVYTRPDGYSSVDVNVPILNPYIDFEYVTSLYGFVTNHSDFGDYIISLVFDKLPDKEEVFFSLGGLVFSIDEDGHVYVNYEDDFHEYSEVELEDRVSVGYEISFTIEPHGHYFAVNFQNIGPSENDRNSGTSGYAVLGSNDCTYKMYVRKVVSHNNSSQLDGLITTCIKPTKCLLYFDTEIPIP